MLLPQLAAVGPVATALQSELPGVPRGNLCLSRESSCHGETWTRGLSNEHGTAMLEVIRLQASGATGTRSRTLETGFFFLPLLNSMKRLLCGSHWARHWGRPMQEEGFLGKKNR